MKHIVLFTLAAAAAAAHAGQPVERFRGADRFTFCFGSAEARYGNLDATVTILVKADFLGDQSFTSPTTTPEARSDKAAGSLDFTIKLSDFDVNLPPDPVTLAGTDLGSDRLRHVADTVLPGPYHIQGVYNGIDVDITVQNVHVTAKLDSQASNSVTLPWVNPVLGELCDVQLDDDPSGGGSTVSAVPAQVSGYIVSPLFKVRSLRVDVTGIDQSGQVPAHLIRPTGFNVALGKLGSGTTASLRELDGDALMVCKYLVPNANAAPINVEFTANGQVPQYLSLWSVGRMANSGQFSQTLEMYDFAGSGYAGGDVRTDPIGTSFVPRKLDATGDVSRYFQGQDALRARYRIRQTGIASVALWCSEHDQVGWIVTP
ncbi:MAG: hypothetical protein JST30_14740 [Armatimonadetes bacterium]|nr:hypothetical protein [Armatimonadota bacterium]